MKYLRVLVFFSICVVLVLVLQRSTQTPAVSIVTGPDHQTNIDIHLTRQDILKTEMPPVVLMELDGTIKLADFADNGVLRQYGFKKGDVIISIDGQEIDSIKKAFVVCSTLEREIFESLDEREVRVSLLRDGRDVTMNVTIPEFSPEKIRYTMELEKRAGK
jgi:C-terminal processing protease CtpA/Prc